MINQVSSASSIKISTDSQEAQKWHRRLGHLYYARLQHLSRAGRVKGLPFFGTIGEICADYLAGHQHHEHFPKVSTNRATHVLQLIHSDLVGSIKIESLCGSRYFVVFADDFSRKSWVFFMRQKSETFQKFCAFRTKVEKETGK
jgi:hypothetical protein